LLSFRGDATASNPESRAAPYGIYDIADNAGWVSVGIVRVRLWKRELQNLANELGIAITVCHLPPGTKWNGSSIACSRSSHKTGVTSRSSATKPSSN
jgi:hypothetical protein